jgi:hypothetical protein
MDDDVSGCGPAMFAAAAAGAGKVTRKGNLCSAQCWKDGQEVRVIVDDLLPCVDRRPAFGGHVEALDDLLLQKAYAKLQGSYEWILSADWAKSEVPHEALGWENPTSLDSEHPLAPLAMEHALAMAKALYATPASGSEGQSSQQFLESFVDEFAGGEQADRSIEIAALENNMATASNPGEIAAGGPSAHPVIGKGKALKVTLAEPAWVKITIEQLHGNRSIFLNIYEDDGEAWMQDASGFATQTEEEFVLEVYLQPKEKPYLIVPSMTLDTYSCGYDISIDSSAEIEVERA